jgi:hypothetical protein
MQTHSVDECGEGLLPYAVTTPRFPLAPVATDPEPRYRSGGPTLPLPVRLFLDIWIG